MNIIRLTALFVLFVGLSAFAQTTNLKNKSPYPTKYTSTIDQSLVIKSIAVAPVFDNANNIYNKSAEEQLKNLVKNDYYWSLSDFNSPKKDLRIDEFDESSQLTMQALDKSQADGLLTCFIIKGPQGLSVQLNLYTHDQGRLLLHEEFLDPLLFEVTRVNEVVAKLYASMKSKLPYSGYITSRNGNAVTVNIGSKSGLKVGDVITVAQVLKINRHPKLKFMISVEKEILGRVSLTQVESDSSFGQITFEKENGVIERGSKILPLEGIRYPISSPNSLANVLPDEQNAVEWVPAQAPQYGRVSLMAGLTDYSDNAILTDDTSFEASKSAALTFDLTTELWITPDYYAELQLQQASFEASNDLSGSSPSSLNFALKKLDISFGYKYLIDGNFWGPQIFGSFGHYSHKVNVSDSTPTAFTSFELKGYDLTVGGMFPVTLKNDISIGAKAKFLFFEKYSESPVSSGGGSPSFNQFELLSSFQYSTNVNIKGTVTFTNLQMSYSADGDKVPLTRSLDEKLTTYLVGIEYLF